MQQLSIETQSSVINFPVGMATAKQRGLTRPSVNSCVHPFLYVPEEVSSFTICLTTTVTAVDGVGTSSTEDNLNSSSSLLAITLAHFKPKVSFI